MGEADKLELSNALGDFKAFFAELNDGNKPYQWQLRLLEYVLKNNGEWPDCIDAPTGAGKTSAIEVHLFVNALAVDGEINPPRRMIAAVNRRAVVDKQFERASAIREKMVGAKEAKPGGIVARVAAKLLKRAQESVSEEGAEPFSLVEIRGGAGLPDADKDWRVHPTRVAILCMTPDMFGSRLLFRGYGTSKYMRPVEAALLAYDSVLFLDEAHLNRQLDLTARQVARIEAFAASKIGVTPLQVCASTATHAERGKGEVGVVGVCEEDFAIDGELCKRLTCRKPLGEIFELKKIDFTIKGELAKKAIAMLDSIGGPIACVFNSPKSACEFNDALRNEGYNTECVVGKMRQFDGLRVRSVLTDESAMSKLDFVVGTQAIEVGIDADFTGMLTELASVSALVQRAGRVNRFGARNYGGDDPGSEAICVWKRPAPKKSELKNYSGIYTLEELEAAETWLRSLEGEEGLTAWVCSQAHDAGHMMRKDYERLELADVEFFSKTSETLAAESDILAGSPSDLALWLNDDFNRDAEVSFAVRHFPACFCGEGAGASSVEGFGASFLDKLPLIDEELVPCLLGRARNVIKCLIAISDGENLPMPLIKRPDSTVSVLASTRAVNAIAPGDIVVVSDKAPIFLSEIVYSDVFDGAASAEEVLAALGGTSKSDIYLDIIASHVTAGVDCNVPVYFLFEPDQEVDSLSKMRGILDVVNGFLEGDSFDAEEFLSELEELHAADDTNERLSQSLTLLKGAIAQDDGAGEWSVLNLGESPAMGFYVVYAPSSRVASEASRKRSHAQLVTLEAHEKDVSDRVSEIADTLELPGDIRAALGDAALHHDEGKRDSRFQALLKASLKASDSSVEEMILAKGRPLSKSEFLRLRDELSLPQGWRHEQLSAVKAWCATGVKDRELVARLVGTSHGRGRTSFEHGASALLSNFSEAKNRESDAVVAHELFDVGLWDEIVRAIDIRYGYWGIAYLEALLRAADAQISAEGE